MAVLHVALPCRANSGRDDKPQSPDEIKEEAREHVESMVGGYLPTNPALV